MAKAEIQPGNCGFFTTVQTTLEGMVCKIDIQSNCKAIQRMAAELTEVNPFQEVSFRRGMPLTHQAGVKYCTHAACPVPVGVIKAIEVEAKMALPGEVTIKVSHS